MLMSVESKNGLKNFVKITFIYENSLFLVQNKGLFFE